MNCLLFRGSCSVLTELGKDQEVTAPTFKPAAFRQMAGKVSQPRPPNHFFQQAERTQKQEKRVRSMWSPNFSAGDSLCLGCSALPWVCKACGTDRICRLRTKAQVTLEVLYVELQPGGDALPQPSRWCCHCWKTSQFKNFSLRERKFLSKALFL